MKIIQYSVVALILVLLAGGVYFLYLGQPALCDHCGRPLHQETLYRIHLRNGQVTQACCPTCGLYSQQSRADVVRVEVADFSTGELLDAAQAFYVQDSSVNMCSLSTPVQRHREGTEAALTWDRCMPGLIAFQSRENAEAFRLEKGGTIKTYSQLMAETP